MLLKRLRLARAAFMGHPILQNIEIRGGTIELRKGYYTGDNALLAESDIRFPYGSLPRDGYPGIGED